MNFICDLCTFSALCKLRADGTGILLWLEFPNTQGENAMGNLIITGDTWLSKLCLRYTVSSDNERVQ